MLKYYLEGENIIMTQKEREEIVALPEKYRPLGAWSFFGYGLLFSIPLIGLICLIIFACDRNHIVRRSYARSYFCILAIYAIVMIIILAAGSMPAIIEALKSLF